MLRTTCILLCLLTTACTHYARDIMWENKFSTTPYDPPDYTPEPLAWPDDTIVYSWLGHATVLIKINGITLLTDPVLLDRVGPPEILDNAFGIRRITQLPLPLESLPVIDIVLISHAHFDHLDRASLRRLQQQQEQPPLYIVPRDTAALVAPYAGEVVELDWLPQSRQQWNHPDGIAIRAFRVEHYAYAHWGDRDRPRGFNGYEIGDGHHTLLFFGDTSYRRHRDERGVPLESSKPVDWQGKFGIDTIRNRPDVCILPIGDGYYRMNHTDPQQALRIAVDIKCESILPVHYGTFILTAPEKQPASMKQAFVDAAQEHAHRLGFACPTPDGRHRYPDIGIVCRIDR